MGAFKLLVLAAGYGTRLESGLSDLTAEERAVWAPRVMGKPKALLQVGSQTVVDHLIDRARPLMAAPDAQLTEVVVITNARFLEAFIAWRQQMAARLPVPVRIISDGTTCNEGRLGAVRDLYLAVQKMVEPSDLLVMAGDLLINLDVPAFVRAAQARQADGITTYPTDLPHIMRSAAIEVDSEGWVTSFTEKPKQPKSLLACPAIYYYRKETLATQLPAYLAYAATLPAADQQRVTDAPGNFAGWLVTSGHRMCATFFTERFDIGNIADYREAEAAWGHRAH